MKRFLPLMLAFALCLLCACGGSATPTPAASTDTPPALPSLDALRTQLLTLAGENYDVREAVSDISPLQGELTIPEGTQAVWCEYAGPVADELLLCIAPDEAGAATLLAIVNARLEERKVAFAGYAPHEVAKLNRAFVLQKGNFVCLIIADNVNNMKAYVQASV